MEIGERRTRAMVQSAGHSWPNPKMRQLVFFGDSIIQDISHTMIETLRRPVRTASQMGTHVPRPDLVTTLRKEDRYYVRRFIAGLPNRLAVEGEEVVTHRFPSGSLGMASPLDIAVQNHLGGEYLS